MFRSWVEQPRRPAGTNISYWIDRLLVRLRATGDYDRMLDDFDRAAEIRSIADLSSTVARGVLSTAQAEDQRKEQAELRERELSAEQGGGWTQNAAVPTELPRTTENLAKARLVVRRLAEIPDERQTQVQRLIARHVAEEGPEWLLRGTHFVTEEERTRWSRALVRRLVITTLEFAALYVGGERRQRR